MRIAIGCDEAAFEMKEILAAFLREKGFEVIDKGAYDTRPVLYPDIAVDVAQEILSGNAERGILLCGTGIGMAMAANKVPGIRAAVCHDPFSTERSRKSNDAQILCMGARVITPELAKMLVALWLECEFAGGGSTAKVERIREYENRFMRGNGDAADSQ
ncbi:MAG: ribose 5-phosphate isomerase B [Clostridiales bacterium]|nr:ribose 5-phosphate isomerase B [Clostridiales bacterium]